MCGSGFGHTAADDVADNVKRLLDLKVSIALDTCFFIISVFLLSNAAGRMPHSTVILPLMRSRASLWVIVEAGVFTVRISSNHSGLSVGLFSVLVSTLHLKFYHVLAGIHLLIPQCFMTIVVSAKTPRSVIYEKCFRIIK